VLDYEVQADTKYADWRIQSGLECNCPDLRTHSDIESESHESGHASSVVEMLS
jgi:hypothetical protein